MRCHFSSITENLFGPGHEGHEEDAYGNLRALTSDMVLTRAPLFPS
jgi:hypothetical protein